LGRRVLYIARELADGRYTDLMELPPEAGGDLSATRFFERGTLFAPDIDREQDDDVPDFVNEATDESDPIDHEEVEL
jgi:hypothetical protein